MDDEPTQPNSAARARQWDIDRYLLHDPTLDSEQFEQRMLLDLSLAEQVADSVPRLQLLSRAAAGATASAVKAEERPAAHRGGHRAGGWAALALVAAVLLAVSVWQFQARFASLLLTSGDLPSDSQLSRMAEHWVACESLSVLETADIVTETDFVRSDEASEANEIEVSESESSEPADWLVEAAREFYLVNHEGSAG